MRVRVDIFEKFLLLSKIYDIWEHSNQSVTPDYRLFLFYANSCNFTQFQQKTRFKPPRWGYQPHESPVLMALRQGNASKGAASFEILKTGPFFDQAAPFLGVRCCLIKKGLVFKISKLAAPSEALSCLRAIKTGDSWGW